MSPLPLSVQFSDKENEAWRGQVTTSEVRIIQNKGKNETLN